MQILQGLFRLLGVFSHACRSWIWPGPTDNADHQTADHFQYPTFWIEEQVLISFPLERQSHVLNFNTLSGYLLIQGPLFCASNTHLLM